MRNITRLYSRLRLTHKPKKMQFEFRTLLKNLLGQLQNNLLCTLECSGFEILAIKYCGRGCFKTETPFYEGINYSHFKHRHNKLTNNTTQQLRCELIKKAWSDNINDEKKLSIKFDINSIGNTQTESLFQRIPERRNLFFKKVTSIAGCLTSHIRKSTIAEKTSQNKNKKTK